MRLFILTDVHVIGSFKVGMFEQGVIDRLGFPLAALFSEFGSLNNSEAWLIYFATGLANFSLLLRQAEKGTIEQNLPHWY